MPARFACGRGRLEMQLEADHRARRAGEAAQGMLAGGERHRAGRPDPIFSPHRDRAVAQTRCRSPEHRAPPPLRRAAAAPSNASSSRKRESPAAANGRRRCLALALDEAEASDRGRAERLRIEPERAEHDLGLLAQELAAHGVVGTAAALEHHDAAPAAGQLRARRRRRQARRRLRSPAARLGSASPRSSTVRFPWRAALPAPHPRAGSCSAAPLPKGW